MSGKFYIRILLILWPSPAPFSSGEPDEKGCWICLLMFWKRSVISVCHISINPLHELGMHFITLCSRFCMSGNLFSHHTSRTICGFIFSVLEIN